MARPQSPDYDERKQAILDAATRIFSKEGFHKASIGQIARECNISKSLLYHYFSSKQEMLYRAMEDHVLDLLATADEVLERNLPPEECLSEILKEFMHLYENASDKHVVLSNELGSLSDAERTHIVSLQAKVVKAFSDTLNDMTGVDLVANKSKTAVAMLLLGMINWTHMWFQPKGVIDSETLAHLTSRIFTAGITSLKDGDFTK